MSITSARQRFEKQKDAWRRGDMKTVKALAKEAEQELLQKGYVKAKPLFGWIEKEWLDKGIAEGAIINTFNGYFPAASDQVEEIHVGYKGRTPITEKKQGVGVAKFLDFLKRYEEFKKKKESQEYTVNQDFMNLIQEKEANNA